MKPASKSPGDEVYVTLCAKLLADLAASYPEESYLFKRDTATVKSRFLSEGVSFLTKTLPLLGKAIDRSLETGHLEVPREFARSRVNDAIPAFLQAMTYDAYDLSGRLVAWDPAKLKQLRQVLYAFYKLEFPYSPDQEKRVVDAFIQAESDVMSLELPHMERFIHVAQGIVAEVLEFFDEKDIEPRHGPGAVATGEKGEEKWIFHRLFDRIHQTYPYYEYYSLGSRELLHRIQWYKGLARHESGIAKVVLVPKDSRGPRLISCEPLEYQWIQQGLGRKLMAHLEQHPLTGGQINFTFQETNRRLALSSSLTRKYATLDLKEASDRVSLSLVRWLTPPRMFRALDATRTTATRLPDGSVIRLNKFAPMGSALCFPVESLVFWAISVGAIAAHESVYYRDVAHHVFVYGDDLIVSTEYVDVVVGALELCGLVVNRDKSFQSGAFRESCGMDAYAGVEVTPVKLHTLWTGKPSDGGSYVSWIEYANELATRGYRLTSDYMWEMVESTYGRVPYGTERSSFPCRIERSWVKALSMNIDKGFRVRRKDSTQDIQVFTKALRPRLEDSQLDDWPRLLRDLVTHGIEDPSKVARPRSAQLRSGWMRL